MVGRAILYLAINLWVFLSIGCIDSRPPTVTINGDKQAAVGDLVKLTGTTDPQNASIVWGVVPESATARVQILDKQLVFASSVSGTYTFFLVASSGGRMTIAYHTLSYGGSPIPPGPDPPPIPPEPPTPPGPEWLNNIEQKSHQLASQIPSEILKDNGPKFAGALELVATKAASGSFESPAAARAELRNTINSTLGTGVSNWTNFDNGIAELLKQYASEGKISSIESNAQAWMAIAKGIRKAIASQYIFGTGDK